MDKYLPTYIVKTVYVIDYNKLYALGKRIILFDLDNTLATYDELIPNNNIKELFIMLHNIGFITYIVSNNHEKRVEMFCRELECDGYFSHILKPFISKFNRWQRKHPELTTLETIMIGDQLLTDIVWANKLSFDSILVKTISPNTQKWYTNINRSREKKILMKIMKNNPLIGKQIMELENEEIL